MTLTHQLRKLILAAALTAGTTLQAQEITASAQDTADSLATPTPPMRDIFAAMPDTLLPMVSRNNRLDCIDFIENDMEAKVRNAIDEYVTLEALTADYARFRTSASAYIELKLFQTDSLGSVLCMVKTAEAGADSLRLRDSNIFFFTPTWQPLPTERYFAMPQTEEFFAEAQKAEAQEAEAGDSEADKVKAAQVREALRYFGPVNIQLSPEEPTLTLTLQTAALETEQRRVADRIVRPLTRRLGM